MSDQPVFSGSPAFLVGRQPPAAERMVPGTSWHALVDGAASRVVRLTTEAIRWEGQGGAPRIAADPLFRRAGINFDEVT